MKNKQQNPVQKVMARYVLTVLIATLLINLLSAYIRLIEAGLGCQPWPACYAVIEQYIVANDSAEIVQKALAPTQLAKKLHRTIATLLVIGVLLIIYQSRKPGALKGANQFLPRLLLGVILLLSVIGPSSYLKTLPVIALINLAGGLTLLAICWWLYLQLNHRTSNNTEAPLWLGKLWLAVCLLVVVQIILGGWVSANFAAAACSELFKCNSSAEYLNQGSNSFWYFRELTLDDSGRVLFDSSTVTIHLAHRFFALITGVMLLIASVVTLKYQKQYAVIIVVLLLAQWCLGALSVLFKFPLMLVMLHNLNAALLLMAVMKVNFQLVQTK